MLNIIFYLKLDKKKPRGSLHSLCNASLIFSDRNQCIPFYMMRIYISIFFYVE